MLTKGGTTVTRPYRMIALLWFLKQSEVTKVEVAPES